MRITKRKQLRIVENIRRDMCCYHAEHLQSMPIEKACLYWAHFTVEEIKRSGLRAIIQAGTCYWRMRHLADGDMVSHNSYGYEFQWNKNALETLEKGMLPEMHVWAAIPDTNSIVDLTAPFFKQRALEEGYEWTTPDPPEFLWSVGRPEGAIYHPNMEATKIAMAVLKTVFVTGVMHFQVRLPELD